MYQIIAIDAVLLIITVWIGYSMLKKYFTPSLGYKDIIPTYIKFYWTDTLTFLAIYTILQLILPVMILIWVLPIVIGIFWFLFRLHIWDMMSFNSNI